jgi:hypothetical protein
MHTKKGGGAMTTNDEGMDRYIKFRPLVTKTWNEYAANMFQIEELWKLLVKEQFSSREHKDQLWGLCQKGMPLAWKWVEAEHKQEPSGSTPARNLPCYTRAIMLLEKEGRFDQAIVLCDQALHWTQNSEWYARKKDGFLKKRPVQADPVEGESNGNER